MKRSLVITAALSLLTGAGFAIADNAASPQAQVASVISEIEAGKPMRMIYELEAKAYVLFIPATGKAKFDVKMNPDDYIIDSRVKVTGIADWFVNYDMYLQATGYMRGDHLKTYAYNSQNRDGKKNRRVTLKITDDDFEMEAIPRFGNLGDPAATTEQVLQTNDPITALITFALEPRVDGADPCGGPIKIFDGRQLTHLHLENAGTKDIKTPAWRGKAIECHVTMDKVAGYKPGEADNDNLTGIDGPLRMWLAPLSNGATVPVKIQADTDKIGKVTLQARKLRFEPIETDEASIDSSGG